MTVTVTDRAFRSTKWAGLTALAVCLAAACGVSDPLPGPGAGSTSGGEDDEGSLPTDYDPQGPAGSCDVDALLQAPEYGTKVKTLLTGLPLTNAEHELLVTDPTALRTLVQAWVEMPEADATLRRFFMTAFQQTGLDRDSFFYLLGHNATNTGFYRNPNSPMAHDLINQNLKESFAHTALALVRDGRPFSEVLTTDTWMMTTAMMAYLAYIDDEVINDDESHTVRTTPNEFPTIRLVVNEADAPPPSQALDPSHANFMKFHHDRIDELDASCNVTSEITLDTTQFVNGEWRISGNINSPSYFVFSQMIGRHISVRRHPNTCSSAQSNNRIPMFDRNNDFNDWRPVKIVKPADSSSATPFYDLKALRQLNEMALHTERRGFLSHPAFHGTWQTNEDNSARVSINQALIVALGESFDGVAVSNFDPPNLDEGHADPTSECYGCHQTLDPMRDYFRASFTNFYGQQLDPERMDLQADFVFNGVTVSGNGISDLVATLAEHPSLPVAWAQKLCYYANSEACPEGEALDEIVAAFIASGLDFEVLVTELFSSPLITGSECVEGVDAGTRATIARRSLFCEQLSNRLGQSDMCGLHTLPADASSLQNDLRAAMDSVPDDTFSRAVIEPVVIAETGMFARANREAACVLAAQDAFADIFGQGAEAETVLPILVTQLMALPDSDERYQPALAILQSHVANAVAEGASQDEALMSAFAVACMSPGSAGVGF